MTFPRELLDRERPQKTREQLLDENLKLRAANRDLRSAAENLAVQVHRTTAHNNELRTWVRSLELRVSGITVIWCGQAFITGLAIAHWWTYQTVEAGVYALAAGGISIFGVCVERWARVRARKERCTW